ncbi:MAG: hypothetical protein ACRDP7_20880 [Trebonia sp.]
MSQHIEITRIFDAPRELVYRAFTDPGDPRATRLNALPKYVVSTTLDRVEWNNSILVRGDVAEQKRQPGGEL